jgi:hypothetical protein
MTAEEYQEHLVQLHMMVVALRTMPLKEMMEQQSRAEAIGPILDPTAYMSKGKAFGQDQQVTRAARAFQKAIEEIS